MFTSREAWQQHALRERNYNTIRLQGLLDSNILNPSPITGVREQQRGNVLKVLIGKVKDKFQNALWEGSGHD